LNDFLNEIHQIACFEPSIVEHIDEDLDLHAKKKKLLRLADVEFLAGQTLDLPKLQLQLSELKIDKIQLETGRAQHRCLYRLSFPDDFRSFWGAWRTIAGYEAIHMIRKGQACWSAAGAKVGLVHHFILGLFAATS
jgi:hypothetical protein